MFLYIFLKNWLGHPWNTSSSYEKDLWQSRVRKEGIGSKGYTEPLYSNILSMLQCLEYSLELTLQKAKNIKWSSSNGKAQLWHMYQKQGALFSLAF